MILSAEQPSGDSPPKPDTAEELREQLREQMKKRHEDLYGAVKRDFARAHAQELDTKEVSQPPPAKLPGIKKVPGVPTRRNLNSSQFDSILDMAEADLGNHDIARRIKTTPTAVAKVRRADYRGMSDKQNRRAKMLRRKQEMAAVRIAMMADDKVKLSPPSQPPPLELGPRSEESEESQHLPFPRRVTEWEPVFESVEKVPDRKNAALIKDKSEVVNEPKAPWQGRPAGVHAVLDVLDRQQRRQAQAISDQAQTISDLVTQVKSLLP